MISVKKRNGKLNILLSKPELDHFIDAAFFIMLAAHFCINSSANYPYYVGFFLFIGLSLAKVIIRLRYDGVVNVPGVCWWYLAFALFSLASVLWARSPVSAVNVMSRMVQILAVVFCMAQSYATKHGFERCLKTVCRAGIFCTLYIFIKTPFSDWFNGRLGYAATGQNVNILSLIIEMCMVMTLYYAIYQKKRIYYVFAFIEFAAIVLSGSRKSVLVALFAFIVLYVIKDKSYKTVLRLLFAVALAAAAMYAVMNVDVLYSAIGRRFESMLEYFQTDSGDYSIYARNLFITYARQFFLESPWFGSGISNFIYKIGTEIGIYAYAHNNYYELLVDVGLVGFSIYYSFYVYILVKLVKIIAKYGDSLAKVMLTLMISLMICEYGIVVYYYVYAIMFVCVSFLYVCAFENEHGRRRIFASDSGRLLLKSASAYRY